MGLYLEKFYGDGAYVQKKCELIEILQRMKISYIQERQLEFHDLKWCVERDLNPHELGHYPLKIACLPIPPPTHKEECMKLYR